MVKINKVLIIRFRRIGDILLTTPVIRSLHKAYPDAKLDFIIERPAFQILKDNKYLNKLFVIDYSETLKWVKRIRKERYDLILDYFGNSISLLLTLFSGAKVRVGYKGNCRGMLYNIKMNRKSEKEQYTVFDLYRFLDSLNIHRDGYNLDFFIDEDSFQFADRFINSELDGKDFVLISPTSIRQTKVWKAEYFGEIIKILKRDFDYEVVIVWAGETELKVANSVNAYSDNIAYMAPPTNLKELGALIARSKLMITNDNGPMHIAVSQNVPTITIYGPTNPVNWNAPKNIHRAVYADIPCIGCGMKRCAKHDCMNELKPERVIKEFQNLIKATED